jgi:PiT family inorganic phosphate transporter
VIEIFKYNTVPEKVSVEMWILVVGGVGIVLGLATFGYRVMYVVGTKVTEITPSRGVAADMSTMATVLACSKMGLPISTTHTLVGAIIGVGLARGITAINRKIVGSIFASWIVTIPVAAILTVVLYLLGKWLFW